MDFNLVFNTSMFTLYLRLLCFAFRIHLTIKGIFMGDQVIDEDALLGMKSLLGEQFNDTLDFCYCEFDRLNQELAQSIHNDNESAIRHVHSLKSNAAQFGALTLAEMAKKVEHSLNDGNLNDALVYAAQLQSLIDQTKDKINLWKGK